MPTNWRRWLELLICPQQCLNPTTLLRLNGLVSNANQSLYIVDAPVGIFGVPLQDSIKYANVAISLTDEKGESYVYGYVPIVIAKCGVFLKEKGTT